MPRVFPSLLVMALNCTLTASNAAYAQQRVRTIGVEDGPVEYTFGWIDKVAADPAGRIIVLDRMGFGVRWYQRDGTYGGAVGRTGQGPGELQSPTDIALDADGRLHVLDAGNGRISIYAFAAGDWRSISDQRVTIPRPAYFCAGGDSRFILSLVGERLLHEVDAAGRVMRSFGEPVHPDRRLAQELRGAQAGTLLADGGVACDGQNRRVLYYSMRIGEVRLYNFAGDLLWQVQLPGFVRIEMRYNEQLGMCCEMRPDRRTNSHHQVAAGLLLGEAVLLSVRIWYGDGLQRYETRTLDVRNGVQLAQAESPEIISVVRDGGDRIGYRRNPYPHIRIVTRAR